MVSVASAVALAPLPVAHALIVPVEPGSFWPGQPLYEHVVGRHRMSPRLFVFGLVTPFGIVPEATVCGAPELFAVTRDVSRATLQEAAVRTRAWLDQYRHRFERLVVVLHGPTREVWSQAVRGARKAPVMLGLDEQVRLVHPSRRTGLRSLPFQLELALPPSVVAS